MDGYSQRTIALRYYTVLLFARHGDVYPEDLTNDHVLSYLRDRDIGPRTRSSYFTGLQQWCKFAGIADVTEEVRRPRAPRLQPRPVSEAGLARLLLAADPREPVHAWLVLGAYAGLRSMESAGLRADAMEDQGVGQALRIVGKGGQSRVVPAAQVVVDALAPWVSAARGRGRLWPEADAASVQWAIRSLAKKSGIKCSSHQLRHRFGTQVYRASRDLLLTQHLMGHASPATTAGYALVASDEGAATVAALPGAGPMALMGVAR